LRRKQLGKQEALDAVYPKMFQPLPCTHPDREIIGFTVDQYVKARPAAITALRKPSPRT
jgi:hypothetical protein